MNEKHKWKIIKNGIEISVQAHQPSTLLFLLRSFNRLMTVAMPLVYLILLVTTYLQLGLGQQVGVYVLILHQVLWFCLFFRKKINHRDLMKLGTSVLCLTRIVRDSRCPVAMSFRQPSSPHRPHASLPVGLACLLSSALLGLVRV